MRPLTRPSRERPASGRKAGAPARARRPVPAAASGNEPAARKSAANKKKPATRPAVAGERPAASKAPARRVAAGKKAVGRKPAPPVAAATASPDPDRAVAVLDRLEAAYPETRLALDFTTPLELLIATILAAQAQDKKINEVTPALFRKYPDALAWATAPLEQLQEDLRPTGFFNQKARAVQGTCQELVARHEGEVPEDLEALVALPGVGRKTANVVLGAAFGHPDRVAVDTHVKRLSQRLGWTREDDPEQIEQDLERLWPATRRTRACHLLQHHGRQVCVARAPRCPVCPVNDLCPYPTHAGAVGAPP